jgi:hypothetical protein
MLRGREDRGQRAIRSLEEEAGGGIHAHHAASQYAYIYVHTLMSLCAVCGIVSVCPCVCACVQDVYACACGVHTYVCAYACVCLCV